MAKKISKSTLSSLRSYVRATDYLTVAQIYLRSNVLLSRRLGHQDIKARLLGHWGTCPGINFVHAHINRLIIKNSANFLYIIGPGHGFPALQANLFVEKSLSKFYPKIIPYSEAGIREICSKFSAPYGYPSHANPAAPGTILEGGELGYSLSVAFGAVLDSPDLIACCLVGDGEAESGPLASSWQINKLLSPKSDGAVLPIIHANGYKISGPTMIGRMSDTELTKMYEGLGYRVFIVDEKSLDEVHISMAQAMDQSFDCIRDIQAKARSGHDMERPEWPMIILRTPKGWHGPAFDKDKKLEGNCLSHQVVFKHAKTKKRDLLAIESWLKSYKFHQLFEQKRGKLKFSREIVSLIPKNKKTCGTQKYAFGGEMMEKLTLPKLEKLAKKFKNPGVEKKSSMKTCGKFLAEILRLNNKKNNFRVFSPDETYSNKIDAVMTQTSRVWQWPIEDFDQDISREGKVMEMLSEHALFGLHHGYSVTGRHGVFVSYEAFAHVIASMADQYTKFLSASEEVLWRRPIPSLNIILTSLLERQDHNGFSHQNPSFLSSMMEKDGKLIHAYFPPDSNSMLVTLAECFSTQNRLNIIIAGKKDNFSWLSLSEAREQMKEGIMTWKKVSDSSPHIVVAASGDYVTAEALAGIQMLKKYLPEVRVRFVNISELTSLGVGDDTVVASDQMLDKYFTKDKGVVFNFHGYPHTIKKLLFDYRGADRFRINGYIERGSTTSPLDMMIRNRTSRFHIVLEAIEHLRNQKDISPADYRAIVRDIERRIIEHRKYICKVGDDPREIKNWQWK